VQEYGEPRRLRSTARKPAWAEALCGRDQAARPGEETIVSDLTYDLRSGDPDFIDKLCSPDVSVTWPTMPSWKAKTGLMSALVEGRYDLVPIPDARLGPRKLKRRQHLQHGALPSALFQQAGGCRSFSTARHRVAGGKLPCIVTILGRSKRWRPTREAAKKAGG